jgi:anaerobic selenocysteine-containing dehydrogenase
MATRTEYRTCHLCEATCGLELHLDGRAITLVRGDRDDVFSHGFLCPKGTALKHLETDPDRVRRPLLRNGDGTFREATWDEAFAAIDAGLTPIREQHGNDALAVYVGNPNAHNLAGLIFGRAVLQAARTKNVYSASTVDQMPKQVSAGLMFGGALSVPVPDIDRTEYLLILGANPFESNGSLMTAPDFPGRLRALRDRGGKFVVVDPRRTKTADEANEHLAIRPGADALFLFAIAHVLFADDLVDLGTVRDFVNGLDTVRQLAADFAPERVAHACGIDAVTIRRIAHELAAAPAAAVYGRIGTCTQEFGTLASWLVDVVNICTGNLDRAGGALFTKPAAGSANTGGKGGTGRGVTFGRRTSRVRGLPEYFGELPVVCLAEEIETPGAGQVRAMITIAGNPASSTPDTERLNAALASLDFMVSVDIYVNETTRHADVILPPEPLLARGHYDLGLYNLAIRNVANYSPPLVELEGDEVPEWRTLLRLAGVLQGMGPDADVDALDEFVIAGLVQKAVTRPGNIEGRDSDEILQMLANRRGPERVLDFMLRTGPYGDGFGADPEGLTLAKLEANPHGIDFGPLQPRIPDVLRTPTGMIELAPEACVADVERLRGARDRGTPEGALVLVGRRDLRSNNSWRHNVGILVKGKARCTVHVHPDDAARLNVANGAEVRVRSSAGEIVLPAEVTDAVRPGVVSVPHGWGHDLDGMQCETARKNAGANSNVLARGDLFDPLSGNAVLNGIPVELAPAG